MRLFEITGPRWFITVIEKQKLGDIIERQGSVCPMGSFLEGHLERRRPQERLPRAHCFYLMPLPPAVDGFIYEVEPVGPVDRQHTGWLRLLRSVAQTSVGELDQYAGGYWSDKEVPQLRDAPWENRAAQVKLLKCVVMPGPRRCPDAHLQAARL